MFSHGRPRSSASQVLLLATLAAAQAPLQIPFNSSGSAYGPDGPWNYITLAIGAGPASNVDFYPKLGDPNSLLIKSNVCVNQTSCLDPIPGYYNQTSSSATATPQPINSSSLTVTQFDGGLADELGISGNGNYWIDTINGLSTKAYENISFFVSNNITFRTGGSIPYNPLSLLSLESSTGNNSQIKTPGNQTVQDQTLMEAYANSTGGSLAFGLHMGSVAFNQPGSLYLGGYDSNRIIETPATFTKFGYVPLNTLSFGTASGNSPWAGKTLPPDFLGGPTEVLLSPQAPHIYLGQNMCDMMKEFLPIQYDNDTNLFLWKTDDPAYQDIVTSPSYLNFTFGDPKNTSIRVPFALLNLTLDSPLKSQPTPYFPCSPRTNGFNLGRAFLQAAFLSQGYLGTGTIQVAQAPGPSINGSTKPNPVQIFQNNPDTQPPTNAPKWEDTWAGILKPLGADSSTSGSTSNPDNGGSPSSLSGGAIAGIVIGVLAGVGIISAVAVYFCLQRRRASGAPQGLFGLGRSAPRPATSSSDIPPPPPPKEKMPVSGQSSVLATSRLASIHGASISAAPPRNDPGIIPIAEAENTAVTRVDDVYEMQTNELPREMEAESHLSPSAVAYELPGSGTTNTRSTNTRTPASRQSRHIEPVEMDASGTRTPSRR